MSGVHLAVADGATVLIMPVLEFLSPDSVVTSLRARAKKQILQELSAHAVRQLPALDEREVFETLLQRERLGSTGIGDGVAIPHGKLPGLDRLFGLVARLERPVDFESLDGQPIDIAFLLLAPEGAGPSTSRRSPKWRGCCGSRACWSGSARRGIPARSILY